MYVQSSSGMSLLVGGKVYTCADLGVDCQVYMHVFVCIAWCHVHVHICACLCLGVEDHGILHASIVALMS